MVAVPLAYITVEIQQNTPMGVKSITFPTTKMDISFTALHRFTNGSAFSFRERQARPMITANARTCSILPFVKLWNGLDGINVVMVSSNPPKLAASTVVSVAAMVAPSPR